jgi:hypothetical protein
MTGFPVQAQGGDLLEKETSCSDSLRQHYLRQVRRVLPRGNLSEGYAPLSELL